MKPLLSMMVALMTQVALATPPLETDFSSGKLPDLVTEENTGRVQVAGVNGAKVLAISDGTARFRDVAVKPAAKYTLTLDAAFEGDAESLEENPRFEIFTRLGHTSPRLPAREIRFCDANGKPVGKPLVHAMPFKDRHTYTDVFYTPPDAMNARVILKSGKDLRVLISKLRLDGTAAEGAINVNPAFQLGDFNYSGWENIAAGGQLIERDGKTVLDTKYGSSTVRFPLAGPGTYAISAKATGNGFNSVVIVRIYGPQGEKQMETSTRRYGPPTYFVPPRGAASASILVYSCLLEEVRLVRVGDEQSIERLRGN
jgi:hypothetical protein